MKLHATQNLQTLDERAAAADKCDGYLKDAFVRITDPCSADQRFEPSWKVNTHLPMQGGGSTDRAKSVELARDRGTHATDDHPQDLLISLLTDLARAHPHASPAELEDATLSGKFANPPSLAPRACLELAEHFLAMGRFANMALAFSVGLAALPCDLPDYTEALHPFREFLDLVRNDRRSVSVAPTQAVSSRGLR
jgi:hypothetical protein